MIEWKRKFFDESIHLLFIISKNVMMGKVNDVDQIDWFKIGLIECDNGTYLRIQFFIFEFQINVKFRKLKNYISKILDEI